MEKACEKWIKKLFEISTLNLSNRLPIDINKAMTIPLPGSISLFLYRYDIINISCSSVAGVGNLC
jgi:hypothetical protein